MSSISSDFIELQIKELRSLLSRKNHSPATRNRGSATIVKTTQSANKVLTNPRALVTPSPVDRDLENFLKGRADMWYAGDRKWEK
jgi:hypothetical protein